MVLEQVAHVLRTRNPGLSCDALALPNKYNLYVYNN